MSIPAVLGDTPPACVVTGWCRDTVRVPIPTNFRYHFCAIRFVVLSGLGYDVRHRGKTTSVGETSKGHMRAREPLKSKYRPFIDTGAISQTITVAATKVRRYILQTKPRRHEPARLFPSYTKPRNTVGRFFFSNKSSPFLVPGAQRLGSRTYVFGMAAARLHVQS